jgi:hypothetical protein
MFSHFAKATKEITEAFSRIAQPEEYFKSRIKINFLPIGEIVHKNPDVIKLSPKSRVDILCKFSNVQLQPGTSFLLGLADSQTTSFKNLADAQDRQHSSDWINDILRYLSRSFIDVDQSIRQQREQILSPIVHGGQLYQPVIARLEYSGGWPTAMVVIFVKMPPFSEDPYLMISQGMPKPIVYMSVLGRLSRRFRWSFLDPLVHAAEVVAPGAPPDDLFWNKFMDVFARGQLALDYIEQEGSDPEIAAPGNVRVMLGLSRHELENELWTNYPIRKAELLEAVETRSMDKVLSILRKWQKENKDFMLLLLGKLREEILKLEPAELTPEG